MFQARIRPYSLPLIYASLVFLISAGVFSQYGFNGTLVKDDSVFIYAGQQLAKGVPPYVSIFQPKSPASTFVIGFAASFANHFGFNDILTVRVAFFAISCLAVVTLYLLGSTLFKSHKVGLLAAFVFVGFWGFGRHAASGPRAKTLVVLFQILALLLTTRRKWFWAGVFGSLASLTWQPTVVYPLLTIFLAFMQAEARERTTNLIGAVSGFLSPVIVICTYFLYQGALDEFVTDAILFPLYLERQISSLSDRIVRIFDVIIFRKNAYSSMTVPIFLGLLMIGALYVWRIRAQGGISRFISNDLFAAFLLSFPAPVIWSTMDFQGYPDFYVFLPYAAIGFAWMLSLALQSLKETEHFGQLARQLIFLIICVVLIGRAAREYRITSENGLDSQLRWAQRIESRYLTGDNDILLSIGRPEILVLLHRTNQNRHIVINGGEHNLIEASTPGGLSGWLNKQISTNPSVILLGNTKPAEVNETITRWLKNKGFKRREVGQWTLYVRETTQE